jgi:hypothetical protein
VPDRDTAGLVTDLFRMRAAGASLGACATRLQRPSRATGGARGHEDRITKLQRIAGVDD